MSSATPIEPYVQTTTQTITSFTVSCRSVNLFTNASFTVDLLDVNGNLISRQVLTMTTEQYLAWQNNDEYVINWVEQTLGFTPLPPPVEEVTSGP